MRTEDKGECVFPCFWVDGLEGELEVKFWSLAGIFGFGVELGVRGVLGILNSEEWFRFEGEF